MLIEATKPLLIRCSTGDLHLTPGTPVEIPTEQARRVLLKAKGKVREVPRDWSPTWRELAALTAGLTATDRRLPEVMERLNACDTAYLNNDWAVFCEAVARIRVVMAERRTRLSPMSRRHESDVQ